MAIMSRFGRSFFFFQFAVLATLIIAQSYSNTAMAQFRDRDDRRIGETEKNLDFRVRQTYSQNSKVSLTNLANLNSSQYDRYQVTKVEVRASTQDSSRRGRGRNRAQLSLKFNGSNVSSLATLNQRTQRVDLSPHRAIDLDNRRNQLELAVSGIVYIESVHLTLSPVFTHRPGPPGPRPGPGNPGGPNYQTLKQEIYQYVDSRSGVKVDRYLNFRDHHGSDLMNVAVEVESDRYSRNSSVRARLVINGSSVGSFQNIRFRSRGHESQRALFRLPPSMNRIIGKDVRNVEVEFDGAAYVTKVEALVNQLPNRGPRDPRNPRDFYQQVQYRNIGHAQEAMVDLINLDFSGQHAQVFGVTIEAIGKGRSSIKVCQRDMFHRVSNCSERFSLQNRVQNYHAQLSRFNGPKANEVVFVMDGAVEIKSLRVQF